MVEVLFGDSEAASMKAAKNKIVIGKTDGPTSVWMAGKKRPPERESAGWIEGTAEEVICLAFMLEIGDIKKPADSRYRKDLIYSIHAKWGSDNPETDPEYRKIADSYINEMDRLDRYLKDGESIRIWYSDAPYSRCGFYSLCAKLRNCENDIRAVKLPEYKVQTNSIALFQNWGEIAADEFAGFLTNEKRLAKEELRMFAGLWSELAEDNSPLRTVINGRVTGAPEDFYDFLIWKRLTKEPVKEARLIGDIMGYSRISVGDWWYAERINFFIEQGKIRIVENAKNEYARMICLG